MILICNLQFFFHIYDRWRNSVGVRVLRILFSGSTLGFFCLQLSMLHLHLSCPRQPAARSPTTELYSFERISSSLAGLCHLTSPLLHSDFIARFHIPFQAFFSHGTIPLLWSFYLLFSLHMEFYYNMVGIEGAELWENNLSPSFRWFLNSRTWR